MKMKELIELKDYLEEQIVKEKNKYQFYTGETITESPMDMPFFDVKETDVTIQLE
ncbi:MAG: hypothetical protein V1779_00035 [bacterium]